MFLSLLSVLLFMFMLVVSHYRGSANLISEVNLPIKYATTTAGKGRSFLVMKSPYELTGRGKQKMIVEILWRQLQGFWSFHM